MKNAVLLAVVGVCALGGTAWAQRETTLTAEGLYRLCTNQEPKWAEACNAYISGISDTASAYQRLMPMNGGGARLPAYICIPGQVRGTQLRQTVVSYLNQHRERARQVAVDAVLQGLQESFPCRGNP